MNINPTPLDVVDIAEQQKNEENTKLNKITPIILDRWKGLSADKILMEYYFTNGRISVDEYNEAHRGQSKKVDYLLLYYNNVPIALVEAKGEDHAAAEGYQQAVDYARLLDVPFAYATNGDDLIEKDMIAGTNKNMKISDFPYAKELWDRFVRESGFTEETAESFAQPFHTDATGRKPRYYQRIAINKVMQCISEGQKRILLVMATGTGKTYTAFQFIYRLWNRKSNLKVLYLADRNILIDQTINKDFMPFGSSMVKIDNKDMDTSFEIYLGLYQQLTHEEKDYYKEFPSNFFDLIVVDECHRGSASEESHWRKILDYYSSAVQVGMTATPKDGGIDAAQSELADALSEYNRATTSRNQRRIDAAKLAVGVAQDKLKKVMDESNIAYFGEPVYTYSLKQGIEDGFLAPYKVIAVKLNIDDQGYYPPQGTVDLNGEEVISRLYTQQDFDRTIIVDERRETVAKRITDFMKANNAQYDKTIVFCESIEHARAIVQLLENENPELVAEDSRYVMQITGDNEIGKQQLEYFQDPGSKYPVIAVTSRLLSTGVDIETVKNVVLDRSIGSMTEFKQIIGRGTRVKEEFEVDGEKASKMFFNIIDFRSNYLKFNDPEFDGEPVLVVDVPEDGEFPKPPIKPHKTPTPKPGKASIQKAAHMNGIEVTIIGEMVEYIDEDGNLVKTNINNCIKNNVLTQYPTPDDFRQAWILNKDKKNMAFQLLLETDLTSWEDSYHKRYGYEVDLYDVIRAVAYDIDPPISKERRKESYAVYQFINGLEEDKADATRVLLKTYMRYDFDKLKDVEIFKLPPFQELGLTVKSGVRLFGGKTEYYKFLSQLENNLYEGDM